MIQMPLRISVLLFSVLAISSACSRFSITGSGSNANTATDLSSSRTKDDLEDLRGLLELSQDPDEVTWQDQTLSEGEALRAGKKDGTRRLVAVLRFEGDSAQKFQSSVEGSGAGEAASMPVENWYPAELIAKGQTDSQATLKGISYPAARFAKPPFSEGRLVKIEKTAFYILEMYSQ